MKRKILIKESDLERMVKETISSNEGEQLELDFDLGDGPSNGVIEMAEEKYNSLIQRLSEILESHNPEDIYSTDECYESLNELYTEVSQFWQEIDRLKEVEDQGEMANAIIDDFSVLESNLVGYLEIYSVYQKLKEDLDKAKDDLYGLINR